MTMLADHAAQQLLDFNQKLDINLLDNVVNCLYHGVGPQVSLVAGKVPLFACYFMLAQKENHVHHFLYDSDISIYHIGNGLF